MTALPETLLCAHLATSHERPLDRATRERLAQALLDWFTAGWAALDMPAAATLRELAATSMGCAGPAAVFGGTPLPPMAAGFANAAIAHLREIDDAHRAAMLHPGVVAISPVLALAAARPLSRRRAADAIVAGYEVALRLGEALGARHAASFHATATAGSVGAAAASAMALGLPQEQLHHALGIAATQSAGLWQLVDDEAHASKSLHPGFAVRNGMMAAWAAQAGLPGARAFATGRRGLYALLSGDGPLAALDAGLGSAPARLHTVTIKAWPTCAMLFTPLDALRALMDTHRFSSEEVSALQVDIFAHALKIAGVPWPRNASETPFCLRYVLAVLLQRGALGLADMEAPALDSPELKALAERIEVTSNDEFQKSFPGRRPCRVTVTLRDGRQFSALRELRRGDPEDPFDWTQMLARMRAFVPSLDDAQADRLAHWCAGFADPGQDGLPCTPPPALFAAAG